MTALRTIPNLLTLGNLFLGVFGIYFATVELMLWSTWCIALALVLDFADGFVARLLNAQSELGRELDSLADLVTFGVLPGLVLFQMIAIAQGDYFTPFEQRGISSQMLSAVGFLVPVMGAVRLARFNLITESKTYFTGMPTPAVAILVASIPLILELQFHLNFYVGLKGQMFDVVSGTQRWDAFEVQVVRLFFNPYFYVWLSLVLATMMVAPVRIIALKFAGLGWKSNRDKYVLAIVVGLILIATYIPYVYWLPLYYSYIDYLAIPLIMAAYLLVSIVFNFYPVQSKQTHPEP